MRDRPSSQGQRRSTISDGYGNTEGAWVDQLTCAAELKPRLGGESVLQERLAGRQPYMLTVRYSSISAQITPEWRAFDARKGLDGTGKPVRVFNIRTAINPDMKRRFIEMLVDEGTNT